MRKNIMVLIMAATLIFDFKYSLAQEEIAAAPPPVEAPQAVAQAGQAADSGTVFKVEKTDKDLFSIELRDVEISDLLRVLAYNYKLNIIMEQNVQGKVTASFYDVKLEEAINKILETKGFVFSKEGSIYKVKRALESRIFKLNFISVASILGGSQAEGSGASTPVMSPSAGSSSDDSGDSSSSTPGTVSASTAGSGETSVVENEAISNIKPLLSQEGKVLYGDEPNSLMVIDYPENISKIENFIKMVDVRPQQVLIDTRVVEVTLDDTLDYGVNLKWKDAIKKIGNSKFDTGEFFSNLAYQGVATEYFQFTLINKHISAVLKALSDVTKTDLLSAPRVATVNNRKARIDIVQRVPYVQEETSSISTGTPTQTTKTVKFEEIGIALEVTPTITNTGEIIMDVFPEVSELKNWSRELPGWTSDDPNVPVKDTRKAQTKIVMRSGQTIVIGGLVKDKITNTVSKIPILGDIPYLGQLFRQTGISKQKTELLIFVCPTIIDEKEEKRMAREERFGVGERYTNTRERAIATHLLEEELQIEADKKQLTRLGALRKKQKDLIEQRRQLEAEVSKEQDNLEKLDALKQEVAEKKKEGQKAVK